MLKDICNKPPPQVNCANGWWVTKYFYDKNINECKPFLYGGCGEWIGFNTYELCVGGCRQ